MMTDTTAPSGLHPPSNGQGGTPGSDQALDSVVTLEPSAPLGAATAGSNPSREPIITGAGVGDRQARREAARAEKRAARRALRAERWAWIHKPVPIDRSWVIGTVGGAVLIVSSLVALRMSRPGPQTVVLQSPSTPVAATTAPVADSGVDPFAGFGHCVAPIAASVIGGGDPKAANGGPLVLVRTCNGDTIHLSQRRAVLVANAVRTGTGNVCSAVLQSTDPREDPVVAFPGPDGNPPKGTPVFDCAAPATTTTTAKAAG